MSVVVLGSHGNMGSRYMAILEYLGVTAIGFDFDYLDNHLKTALASTDRVIIATPTPVHLMSLITVQKLKPVGSPIYVLCEKPIHKNLGETKITYDFCKQNLISLYCVNQYSFLNKAKLFSNAIGNSYYDYYKTGNDGLLLDCFQIIALSHGRVTLRNKSPIWKCAINGYDLDISDMDYAYIRMVDNFIHSRDGLWGEKTVIKTMEKIENENGIDWDPSQE